jgi:hypothetical protein
MPPSTDVAPLTLGRHDPGGATGAGGPLRFYLGAAHRFLVIAAIAFWLGGFTFYAGVAIPQALEVLGSHRKVGFITELVTNWLNIAGVAALAVLLLNMIVVRRSRGKWVRCMLTITWGLMATIEIELILLHPMMDRLIGVMAPTPGATPVHVLLDADRFDSIHRVYLMSTTAQWFLGLLHVWCVCVLWGSGEPSDFDEPPSGLTSMSSVESSLRVEDSRVVAPLREA